MLACAVSGVAVRGDEGQVVELQVRAAKEDGRERIGSQPGPSEEQNVQEKIRKLSVHAWKRGEEEKEQSKASQVSAHFLS